MNTLQLSLQISYKAATDDPAYVATEIAKQLERELCKVVPLVGIAFGNILNGNPNIEWLDPNE